jgi:pilus assembly protein Flp/PilA
MTNLITRFVNEDQGQDLLEYALVAGLVALGALVAAQGMSTALTGLYDKISNKLKAISIT